MKIVVLAVGKLKSRPLEELCGEYAERLAHYAPLELCEVKDDATLVKTLDERGARWRVVAMDERGVQCSSPELAKWLERELTAGGAGGLCFVIGGAEGLPDAVRKRAVRVQGLGPLTLAHRLARLILLEQLYRAFTIIRGEPYHK